MCPTAQIELLTLSSAQHAGAITDIHFKFARGGQIRGAIDYQPVHQGYKEDKDVNVPLNQRS